VTEKMLDSKTVYSGEEGVTIRELLDNNIRSIEHVVPKGTYEDNLDSWLGVSKSNGASINPLNFLPSHRTINSKRNQIVFDFDGDTVVSEALAEVDRMSRRFTGVDAQGQWVMPLMSRGDIARCVMYMELMYELKYVNEAEMRKLQEWMKEDAPSAYETAFGLWIRQTQPFGMNIQNPFVSNPELATDELFKKLLNSYLGKEEIVDPVIVIDSVVVDLAGREIITLRNTTMNTVDLGGWELRLATQTRNAPSQPRIDVYRIAGGLSGGVRGNLVIIRQNNFGQTTITLSDEDDKIVSEFQYSNAGIGVPSRL